MPNTARPRSRTATLGVRTGDAYAIDEKTSGKVDATDGGLHVQHGVPESPDPQLTLGIDVTLKPDQVRELLARLEGEMGAPVHDAGRGGFQVDVTQLSGERLIVHGGNCNRRSAPEIAQEVAGHLSVLSEYTEAQWLDEAKPPLVPLISPIRWFEGEARKGSKKGDRARLVEELARVVWSRLEGEPGDEAAGDDGCAESTPQPRGESDARLFLASPLGRGELRRMRDSAALAAVAGKETAPTAGAKRRRERDEAAVAAKKSKVEVKARAKAAAAGERAASLKEGAALKRKAVEERAASRKEASLIRQAAAAAERTTVRTQAAGALVEAEAKAAGEKAEKAAAAAAERAAEQAHPNPNPNANANANANPNPSLNPNPNPKPNPNPSPSPSPNPNRNQTRTRTRTRTKAARLARAAEKQEAKEARAEQCALFEARPNPHPKPNPKPNRPEPSL